MARRKGPTLTFSADTSALTGYLERCVERAGDVVRPAAQAGAQVIYDRVKINVGRLGKFSGNLERSIYQVYSDQSTPERAVYHIGWNTKKAPHGALVEYGHLIRYEYYKDAAGSIRPKVRPDKVGTPRPRRGDSKAAQQYYVLREGGPVRVPPKSFLREARSVFPIAFLAAKNTIVDYIFYGKLPLR